MSAPLVSILMPVRNAGPTLGACLESIARQTLEDWECVAVDDHSTDPTGRILDRAAASDPRIRVVRHEGRGLVSALNHGLGLCRGRLIARMDGDDLMHRTRLARQAEALGRNAELDAVACRVRMFPRRRIGPGMRAYEDWLNRIDSPDRLAAEAWIECPAAHPSLMVRAAPFRAAGYRDPEWPEDYDLVLRLLAAGSRIGVVPERLLMWRRDPGSLAMSDPRYLPERFARCKAHHMCLDTRFAFLSGRRDYILWGYGGTGRILARELGRYGREPAAIVEVHPGRLGNRIRGAPVIGPGDLPEPGECPLVVSVAGAGPRSLVRGELRRRGWRETLDYICAA